MTTRSFHARAHPARHTLSAIGAFILIGWLGRSAAADAVYEWGSNSYGEIGDGTSSFAGTSPTYIFVPSPNYSLSTGVTAVQEGDPGLAIVNGAVYGWASNIEGSAAYGSITPVLVNPLSSGVTAIAAGGEGSTTLAVQSGGVYAWGSNYDGQLGLGDLVDRAVPTPIVSLTSGVTAVAVGEAHSLAIKNGAVYAWGYTGAAGLGLVSGEITTPQLVPSLSNGVTAIAANVYQSMAVKSGALYTWGDDAQGALGDGGRLNQFSPVAIPSLSRGVTSIAAGNGYGLAVKDGLVYAWGTDYAGQLGLGPSSVFNGAGYSDIPVLVPGLTSIVAVAAGDSSSYALSSDGSLWVWGDDSFFQLGIGNIGFEQMVLSPEQVLPPAGYYFTSISADSGDALATVAPVPEASSLCLLAIGAAVLLVHRRQPIEHKSLRFSRPCL